jgi:hypothetical protein
MIMTSAQARSIALQHQLYRFAGNLGKQGVLDVIKTLSYVQLDTISVIERAHHHTLYNRIKDYHPDMLNDLLAKDKTIWEYWAHAAGYVPLEDYPYYKIRMQNFPNGTWEKKFWELHKDTAQPILERIRREGPLSTRHFEDTRSQKSTEPWGNLKPAKIMLELLMWKGDLIVTARDRFQRVYDLTERVIPHYKDIKLPSEQARAEFMISRTLQAHGIATESDINKHITLATRPAIAKALTEMIKKHKLIKVRLDAVKDDFYLQEGTDMGEAGQNETSSRVRILSPFDNAVILRSRLEKIFGYDYALECYVTPARRKFGYWNCPILWKDELVGMLDPKADRKSKSFIINSIFIRKNVWKSRAFQSAFEQETSDFALFNGCNSVSIAQVNLT